MQILDFHCHVYPHAIAEKASDAVARFYQVHRGVEIPDQTAALDDVLQAQAEAGIAKTVLCSAATVPHQVQHINEFLARKAAASGGRCLSFGTLHPDSPDPKGDVEHLLELGLKGVKLHPDMQGFDLNDPKAMKRTGAVSAAHWGPPVLLFQPGAADTGSAGLPGDHLCRGSHGWSYLLEGGHKGTGRPV